MNQKNLLSLFALYLVCGSSASDIDPGAFDIDPPCSFALLLAALHPHSFFSLIFLGPFNRCEVRYLRFGGQTWSRGKRRKVLSH